MAKHFSRENLNPQEFSEYKRKIPWVMAVRVDGPFTVETLEGTMICPDGWLALDVNGNPYPISDEIFEKTYLTRPLSGPEPVSY